MDQESTTITDHSQQKSKSTASKLKSVLRELCQDVQKDDVKWMERVQKALQMADALTLSLCGMVFSEKAEMENLCNQLWNKCVLMKSGVQALEKAKLRHIAFQVVSFITESTTDVQALKKQIVMGLKTARAWLDCKQLSSADKVLSVLNQAIQKLHCLLNSDDQTNKDLRSRDKEDLDHDSFHTSCLEVELRFAQNQMDSAFSAALKAKELLVWLPKEAPYLSMLCYNMGVDSYREKRYETAVQWLRESYDIGKEGDKKTVSRTLRLLANCYMEWASEGWSEKALNTISLANELHSHIAGLHLRLQLLIVTGETCATIVNGLEQLLKESNCNLELCIDVVQYLKKHRRFDVGFTARSSLLEKNKIDPGLGQLLIAILDLLLLEDESENARTFAEECINGHNSDQHLDEISKKQMHVLFWEKAATCFEHQNYKDAITWYNYSLSLYGATASTESNFGKLHKNLATCYLHMGDLEKAQKSVEKAEQCDPRSAPTHFISFKIGLEFDDKEKALTSLKRLLEICTDDKSDQDSQSMICLSAHMALQKDATSLAIPALEWLVSRSNNVRQVVTALKCLVRLQVQEVGQNRLESQEVLIHIRTAYNQLLVAKDKNEILSTAEIEKEADWFMKIAWNLALQSRDNPLCLKELYNLCSQLLSLCPTDQSTHQRQQNCLIMSCAGCLQGARDTQDKEQQKELLEEVLQHLEEYRLAERRAHNSVWAQGPFKSSNSCELLILLFEFEALCRLKETRAEAVLDRALTLPNQEPKLFHNMAAIVKSTPGGNPQLCMRALKAAIRLHLQAETPDFTKCSVDVRQLIDVVLHCNDEEAQTIFREIVEVIDKRAKGQYPEIELLWLMTKSWNHGLQFYNCGKYPQAELWCNLSMKLLKYVGNKDSYEEQMTSLYGEILARLDREQKQTMMEE